MWLGAWSADRAPTTGEFLPQLAITLWPWGSRCCNSYSSEAQETPGLGDCHFCNPRRSISFSLVCWLSPNLLKVNYSSSAESTNNTVTHRQGLGWCTLDRQCGQGSRLLPGHTCTFQGWKAGLFQDHSVHPTPFWKSWIFLVILYSKYLETVSHSFWKLFLPGIWYPLTGVSFHRVFQLSSSLSHL